MTFMLTPLHRFILSSNFFEDDDAITPLLKIAGVFLLVFLYALLELDF